MTTARLLILTVFIIGKRKPEKKIANVLPFPFNL